MRSYLSVRLQLNGGPLWIDYDCIKLPFSGDGDRQELYYHLDGRKWWDGEMRTLSPYVGSGDVVVDIGANLGFLSGVFSKLTGATGQVHSFEPSPSIYAKLANVIRENNYSNVSAYNVGCGKEAASMTLYCPPSSGNATLRPNVDLKPLVREQKTVSIVKLDEFLGPKLERLDLLKIDTEGYEPEVLAGAAGLLERFKPVIYIELGSLYTESAERALRILSDHGYTLDREFSLEKSFSGDNYFALPKNYAR